ncbi:glycosyltransferase family 87 protein [Thermogemmata fonticola]|jgi:hypothetical protein|uniref:DUF2029 domain-containing protein n=1 Tax=Thermogemmata fonticola TaxID=2755323 RepID=A0A7V8VC69_9BACT|nr:glycosyltransferase family 87 protein [Thermogemmata fonticola]MBA2225344.1 DUF2029 domain-containing protein [Thermogemmata fonticola]
MNSEAAVIRNPIPKRVLWWLFFLLLLVTGIAAIRVYRGVMSPELPKDFVQYWAVGRLVLEGENPYAPALQLREQQHVYPERDIALMMWNPPPALPLYAPWGLLPARLAAWLWNGLQLGAVLAASFLLVRVYASDSAWWWFLPLSLGFAGTVWLLLYGQNTGWILFGLAGFAWGQHRGQPWLAGCCGALTVLKPHLLVGFGLVWIWDVWHRGQRRIALLAGVAAVLLATALAHLSDPQVLPHYLTALREPSPYAVSPKDWMLPTASYWLRHYLAPESMAWQFLPSILAALALLLWRLRWGEKWSWPQALPIVVAVSVLTTGYGGWIFDLPVLLVSLIALAARMYQVRPMLLVYLTVWQFLVTWATFVYGYTLHGFWWVAPAVLGPCLFLPFLKTD